MNDYRLSKTTFGMQFLGIRCYLEGDEIISRTIRKNVFDYVDSLLKKTNEREVSRYSERRDVKVKTVRRLVESCFTRLGTAVMSMSRAIPKRW